jgi:hypothetical protein
MIMTHAEEELDQCCRGAKRPNDFEKDRIWCTRAQWCTNAQNEVGPDEGVGVDFQMAPPMQDSVACVFESVLVQNHNMII